MVVGINFMMRKSEHMGSKDARPIARDNFTFFDTEDQPIPYELVGHRPARTMYANVLFAKTDMSGFGRRPAHKRQPDPETCVVQVVERWIARTRDRYGARHDDPLYHVRCLPKYDVTQLHWAMKLAAIGAGLPRAHQDPTSHSLRYGGATMMAAAGYPEYIIAHYGGWAEGSTSMRVYTKPSAKMLDMVSAHMASMARQNTSSMFIQNAFVRMKTVSRR